MDLYLLRKQSTGQWLTREGWSEEPYGAAIYLWNGVSVPPGPDMEWVKFCECPL